VDGAGLDAAIEARLPETAIPPVARSRRVPARGGPLSPGRPEVHVISQGARVAFHVAE
jgi:hypothetical protein